MSTQLQKLGISLSCPSLFNKNGVISATLLVAMLENIPGLVYLQENLVGLGHPWGHHQLKLYPP
jgi:hypothetical protein